MPLASVYRSVEMCGAMRLEITFGEFLLLFSSESFVSPLHTYEPKNRNCTSTGFVWFIIMVFSSKVGTYIEGTCIG